MAALQPETPAIIPPRPALLPPGLPLVRAADLPCDASRLLTGLPPVDAFLGGLALRRTHLLVGARGAGVTSLLHGILAAFTPTMPVLLFDPLDRFFPPAAAAAGVHLPHLFRVPLADDRLLARALALALRAHDAFPLVVWDAGQLPGAHRLERLRALVRGSDSALLITAEAISPLGSGVDGATFAVRHERWERAHGEAVGYTGKVVSVTVTDHARGRAALMPLVFHFPRPLPPFVHYAAQEGGVANADTAGGGSLVSRLSATDRRSG